jgi:hypothetical protein
VYAIPAVCFRCHWWLQMVLLSSFAIVVPATKSMSSPFCRRIIPWTLEVLLSDNSPYYLTSLLFGPPLRSQCRKWNKSVTYLILIGGFSVSSLCQLPHCPVSSLSCVSLHPRSPWDL